MNASISALMATMRKQNVKARVWYSSMYLLLCFYVPDHFAQEQAPQSATTAVFTEAQIVELALKYSPAVQSLESDVKIAEYRLKSSGQIRNPELRISDVSTRYYTDEFDKLKTGLRWRIPQPVELGEEKQKARVEYWEKRVNAVRKRQIFIEEVRKNFADVLMYDRLSELEQQRLTKEDEHVHVIETFFNMGNRTVVQLFKAKMQHAESQNDLDRTLKNQQLARRNLAEQIHLKEKLILEAEELPEISHEITALTDLAARNRPEIELIKQRIELAGKQKRAETMKWVPWPSFIEISYHMQKNRTKNWGEFMTGINLPLFNWNLGNIKASNLTVEKWNRELTQTLESIENEVRSAYLNYRDKLTETKNFSSSAEQLISYAETITRESQEHDTLLRDELLEIELAVIDAKKMLAEMRRDLACALAELYNALGIEGNPEILSQTRQ
jgi:outer membrane protein TolC